MLPGIPQKSHIIALDLRGLPQEPPGGNWQLVRSAQKRLIHFGDTIEHPSVLFFCKESEEVRPELLRILIQIATHRLRSYGEEGGLGMTILLCITGQTRGHRKGVIFIKIHQVPQAVSGKTRQLHISVSTLLYILQLLDTLAKELHRVRLGDE